MSYDIADFVREANKQVQFYNAQLEKFDTLLKDHEQKAKDLEKRRDSLLDGLLKHFMPSFTKENLLKLSDTIHAPGLQRLYEQYEEEKSLLAQGIQAIEQNDAYQKREALGNRSTGVLQTQIDEIKPLYDKAKKEYDEIMSYPAFPGLWERRYGTADYPHQGILRFVNPQYLSDWKESDIIVAGLGANSFVDVMSKFSEVKDLVDNLGSSLKDYQMQLDAIAKLEENYTDYTERLRNIDTTYLSKVKQFLLNFLLDSSKEKIAQSIGQNTSMSEEIVKLDGLTHQIDYLQSLNEKITNDRNVIVEKATKIIDEANRYQADPYRFRNKQFTDEQFQKRFNRDEERYDKMQERYGRAGDTIYGFNDYNRGSLVGDFLWWDIMTDGRLDGNFIPEVYEYRHSHPDYNYGGHDASTQDETGAYDVS
ncbi:MAG: hypothetical protein V4642_04380 [Bacteroidota bacterium]